MLHITCSWQTFRAKSSLSFTSFLASNRFLWKRLHFRSVFQRTLQTVSSLMDGGILAFIITFFTIFFIKVFPFSLVLSQNISFMEQTVLVLFPDYFLITSKSPMFFFFVCFPMVDFEYFQYDLIFDISEQVFPANRCR